MDKVRIYKMIDKNDDLTTQKKLIDDVPFRTLLCGKSGLGKTSIIGSLILLPQFYSKDFLGENCYIFTPLKNDNKMKTIIREKQIPQENIFTEYDDETLNTIYDFITDKYEEMVEMGVKDKKKLNSLIVIDDMSFDGSLKSGLYNAVNRVFMNGRKHLCSIIISSQKYSQISTGQRSNASSIFFFNSNEREKELFSSDNNFVGTKIQYNKLMNDNLKKKRDFIYVDYSNEKDEYYLDTDFNVIDQNKYLK